MSTTAYDARGGMRNVWIITASMTVLAICYTMIIPFLPIYLLELGVPKDDVALWSGLVFGITFLIAGIMAPIWGKIADNKGKKRMALRAGFAIAISYVLIGMVNNEYELLLRRACVGFATGFYSAALHGLNAYIVSVQVDESNGLPRSLTLGNVSASVKEAIERVSIALKNLGMELPPKKITPMINIQPSLACSVVLK